MPWGLLHFGDFGDLLQDAAEQQHTANNQSPALCATEKPSTVVRCSARARICC
jgi:hypothetical protein